MRVRRESGRVIVECKTRHVQAAAVVLVGAVAGVALFFALRPVLPMSARASTTAAQTDSTAWIEAPRVDVAVDGRPFLGSIDAPVTIVEFTDYGCPVCRRHATDILPALLDTYGTEIRYVVRHFPIPGLIPNAMMAATAVECAHEQGKFWAYKTALLGGPAGLEEERLRAEAAAVGLDQASFDECLTGETARAAVQRDLLDAWDYGVIGTPTFFVNGRRFQGARSLETLSAYVRFAARNPNGTGS
jgi:protein-disulfide isomerase